MPQTIRAGTSRITWFGKEVEKQIGLTVKQKLKTSAEHVSNQVKRNISVGRPSSSPGEFPHVDTGRLRNSIFWELRGDDTAIVGTTVKYGVYLELGTRFMAPRPYLSRTLREERNRINRIFGL